MYDQQSHTEVEAFIMKWTLTTTFVGSVFIFITKVIWLVKEYIVSGKFALDIATYIGDVILKALGL